MNIIDTIAHFFSQPQEKTKNKAPEGLCELCWGYQEYDGKIRKLFKDKQIDVNNHRDRYMIIQDFVKQNIDGIRLKDAEVSGCPHCQSQTMDQ